MDDLVQFLRARLDEDEQAAAGASAGPWTPWRAKALLHGLGSLEHAVALPGDGIGSRAAIATASWMDAEHIARHDPARVLDEVDAKRQALTRYENQATLLAHRMGGILTKYLARELLAVVQLLALPYADHPDYRDEWRPGSGPGRVGIDG